MATTATSTQNFVPIKNIRDGVIIKKNGEMCLVILASSINFALKSYDEQRAILLQFQNFLNTLDFSLQICVQSRKLNIEPYLEVLDNLQGKQNNDLMRVQLAEYIEFIRSFTNDTDVMSKSFFIVVPYSPTKLNVANKFTNIFSGSKTAVNTDDQQFEEHRLQLEQRASLVTQGLASVGVRTMPLGRDELVELFYHLYNPADTTGTAPATQS
jgi:hypothetical protein